MKGTLKNWYFHQLSDLTNWLFRCAVDKNRIFQSALNSYPFVPFVDPVPRARGTWIHHSSLPLRPDARACTYRGLPTSFLGGQRQPEPSRSPTA